MEIPNHIPNTGWNALCKYKILGFSQVFKTVRRLKRYNGDLC